MKYLWYNSDLNEIKEFDYLAHLYLRIFEHEDRIIFLGKI